MRVFVTGATGFIGSAVTRELIAHGHQVTGLARTDRAAAALRAAGATPHQGSLRDPASLRSAARDADGAIHLAFSFSLPQLPLGRLLGVFLGGSPTGLMRRAMMAIMQTDRAAIDALGEALQGSDRPLVTTFGTMGLAGAGERAARPATEADPPNPKSPGYGRALNERAVETWASRGVRASIVRLAPSVHGDGDKGLVPQIIAAARKAGEAIYVGDGQNRWSGVHRQDAATLFRLALEKGAAGARYHGVGEEGVAFRAIAEVVGRQLNAPVRAVTLAEASKRLGWFGPFIAIDNPASSLATRQQLGWRPAGPTLLEDLAGGGYFAAPQSS
ncbi:MAG TPA: SDR family oxidoreductase [Caulobacteraceae bacterium]|jgi:nucleoside-diphosphate-sugar epimerase|nr:SDR family oxidoreductase [Caulobacteraceae bacterium]